MPTLAEMDRAVRAAPHDDALRAVFADQLTEAGDPRGALIAHQDELARLTPGSARWAELHAATERLLAAHRREWLQEVLDRCLDEGLPERREVLRHREPVFRGGFLHRIALAPEELVHLDALLLDTPLAGVQLLVGEGLPAVPVPPSAPQWRTLAVHPDGWFTSFSFADVLRWGPFAALEELDLSGCDLGEAGIQLLTGEPTDLGQYTEGWTDPPPLVPGQLRTLSLAGCGVGDPGLAALLRGQATFAGLRSLALDQCLLVDGALLAGLRDAPFALRALGLSGNNGLDLTGLAGWEGLARLERLTLPKALDVDGLDAVLPEAPDLLDLELAGARDLLAAPERVFGRFGSLAFLNLSTTGLKDAGFRALCATPFASHLHRLRVNGCSLSDASVERMLEAVPNLVELDVSTNKLTDDGMERLAGWEGLQHVTRLRIGNNRKVGARGYGALMASPHFDPVELDVGKMAEGELRTSLEGRFGDALLAR
ncbi:MAG: TIGR02996 domain-containing protein [Alphaproteobacteria bacterium]|nr:TIGR02996 domain-containing protein [Alphaproteobacteria bacterium]